MYKIKHIKFIIFAQVSCFPVFKLYIRNSKQPFLKCNNICNAKLTVIVDISLYVLLYFVYLNK